MLPRARVCKTGGTLLVLQTLPPSHTLTGVIYQSNLVEQETCGPCCDGYHICDSSSVCRPTASRDEAYCVPSNVTEATYCGTTVLMSQSVSCESCDQPSPAAQLYEAQFSQVQYSRRHLLTTSNFAAAPSSVGFCRWDWQCRVSMLTHRAAVPRLVQSVVTTTSVVLCSGMSSAHGASAAKSQDSVKIVNTAR